MKKLLSLLSISTLTAGLPAPLLANTTPERANRATNPIQCGESCELGFSKIGKSAWIISGYSLGLYHLEIDATDLNLSSDFDIQTGNGDFIPRPALQLFIDKDSEDYNKINNFYRSNGSYEPKHHAKIYFIDKLINFKVFLNQDLNTKVFYVTSFSAEMPPFRPVDWTKQQSQFNLVDSAKTMIWTRPDLLVVDGALNIEIANPNIDKVLFDNAQQPQTAKKWTINVKPETAPRDHNLQVFFTLDGKPYTSEITVSMLAKIEPTITPVKKQLSDLIKKTDLANIFDNNNDTIFLAVNKANNNIIDDFTQLKIDSKMNNKATITAKESSKSYRGTVDVTYNIVPATVVDLKIDLQPTAPGVQIFKDYLAQLDKSKMINKVDTFYWASSESVVKMIKPTPSSVITGVVYGCDEQWNKTPQLNAIDPTKGIKLDGSQLTTSNGKYVVELTDNLGHNNNLYLQIAPTQAITNYFNTDNGKKFEQWARDNGHSNIRGYSARQLNKLFALSKTWKQSLAHLKLQLDPFVVDNIKNVTQNEINTYKTKLLASIKAQVEKYTPLVVENTDYALGVDNFVAGDWTTSKDVKVQSVEGSTKLLSFTAKTVPVQQKEQPLSPTTTSDNNKKDGDSKLWIIGVVVGSLAGVGVVYLLFKRFIFNKYILPKIYARRQQKVVEQWKRDDHEEAEELAQKQAEREEKSNNKNDNNKGGDE